MNSKKNKLKKRVNSIVEDISSVKKTIESLGTIPEVFHKKIKTFGNGCHVILPREFLNKKARIIIS